MAGRPRLPAGSDVAGDHSRQSAAVNLRRRPARTNGIGARMIHNLPHRGDRTTQAARHVLHTRRNLYAKQIEHLGEHRQRQARQLQTRHSDAAILFCENMAGGVNA